MKEIIVPENVTSIGEQAFYNCYSFKEIIIPKNVTEIERETFYNCSLTSINLENIKEFGKGCFYKSGITKENHPHLPDICFKFPW